MKRYAMIDGAGRVVALTETDGEILGDGIIEVPDGVECRPGKHEYDAVEGFRVRVKTRKERARERLAEIDQETGLARVARETLMAIAGANAPARLAALEAEAAAERLELAKP